MTDINSLSDEELLNLDMDSLANYATDLNQGTETPQETVQETEQVLDDDTSTVEASETSDGTEVPDNDSNAVASTTEQTEASEISTDESTVDYEAFYKTLTKPIRANGRDMVLTDPSDMIQLMQMGANYSKKMEQLKPKKALLKALADNQLDTPEQLGYLIDLAQKKPEAIAKLIKESEFDMYSVDDEQVNTYEPTKIHQPTEFENVLAEVMEDNPSMSSVIGFMNQWDDESKAILYQEPNMLREFSRQKDNGMFDRIVGIVEQERMLGRLRDKSWLEAYSQIETQLMEQQRAQQQNSFTAPRPKATSNAVEQKRKASIPNGNNQTNTVNDVSQLTDEQVLAMFSNY